MSRLNNGIDRVYPIDYMYQQMQKKDDLIDNNLYEIYGKLDANDAQLADIATLQYLLESYKRQGAETDDGARINRAILDINSKGGGTIVFKSGATYTSSVPIICKQNVKLNLNGATVKAISSMTALIDTEISTQLKDVTINNGYVDATDKAQWAIRLQNFAIGWMTDIYAYNGTAGGIKLGQTGAANVSYGMHMTRCQSDRPRGTTYATQPVGSVGILFENATDNTLIDTHGNGNETGIKMISGSSGNVLFNSHNWSRMPDSNMSIAFDIGSTNNHFIGCISDTALQTGFKVTNWRNKFTSCQVYENNQGNSTSNGFDVGTGVQECSFIGTVFNGNDASHTIANDFVFAEDPYSNNNIVFGSSWTFCNTKTITSGGLSAYADSRSQKFQFKRNGYAIWEFVDNATSKDFTLVQRNDTGSFVRNALNFNRNSGLLTIGKALSMPTSASTDFGNNTLFIDSTDGKLKFKDGSGIVQPLY